MSPLLRLLLPLACLLAFACADRLSPADVDALKHVEAHIEATLRGQRAVEDDVPVSVDVGNLPGPIDESFLTQPPLGGLDTATPRPTARVTEKLGDVRP